jgi:hypothetical protein
LKPLSDDPGHVMNTFGNSSRNCSFITGETDAVELTE